MAFIGSIDATPSILDRYLGYYRSLLVNHIPLREDYIIPDRGEDGLFIELKLPEKICRRHLYVTVMKSHIF